MAIIGIDLGTTNSLVAVYKDDKSVLIPNSFGEYLTPSVVSIDGNNIIVGKIAKERLITHPSDTTSLFKRKMGTNEKVTLQKKKYLPEELSAFVIRQLVDDAKRYLNEEITEAVISVPAYFDVNQRAATKAAGKLAGIHVERLINEPSAAAISCHTSKEDETFVVFDFGGGTLDVSVVDCFDNVVSISAVSGDNHLGGSDFDEVIVQELCRQNNYDYSKLTVSEKESLLRICEAAKIALQSQDEVTIESHLMNWQMTLTNQLLLELSMELFSRIKKPIQQAIYDSDIPSDEITKFILVGGSCHMPIVKTYLEELLNVEVVNSKDIDCMVARGLGKYVGIKERQDDIKDIVLTDICPFSLSTNIFNENNPSLDLSSILIKRNTILPTSKSGYYHPIKLGQNRMKLGVYQGEHIYSKDNLELTSLEFKIPVNYKEHEQILVTFTYDINAILAVEALILSTNKVHRLVYSGNGWVSDVSDKRINKIKEMTLNKEYNYTLERAQRIYIESNQETQVYLSDLMLQYQKIMSSNNLKDPKIKTQEFNQILDQIEAVKDNLSIFNNDDQGGLLS